nr:LLM class flavin-dependent oxidoreductase [Bradyrhizobium altum]
MRCGTAGKTMPLSATRRGAFRRHDEGPPIGHRGSHYSVAGPLNVPRSPQGRPVTVQAGGSTDGRDLAAAQAEAVFTLVQAIDEGVAYARDLRARAAAYGRAGSSIVILPGLATVIGSTEAEASGAKTSSGSWFRSNTASRDWPAHCRAIQLILISTSPCPILCRCRPTPTTPCFRERSTSRAAAISPSVNCCARSVAASATGSSSARPSRLPTTSRLGSRRARPTAST